MLWLDIFDEFRNNQELRIILIVYLILIHYYTYKTVKILTMYAQEFQASINCK